jgi:hypothetical protein
MAEVDVRISAPRMIPTGSVVGELTALTLAPFEISNLAIWRAATGAADVVPKEAAR